MRGLETRGNVGFLKSRPNSLVFQNILAPETFPPISPFAVLAKSLKYENVLENQAAGIVFVLVRQRRWFMRPN